MYNWGIISFLQDKSVNTRKGIQAFILKEGVDFNPNHYDKVNNYIQKNWNKFSTFIDKAIKSGELKGTPVKLNTHFDEKRERDEIVRNEFKYANLSPEEEKVLRHIRKNYGPDKVQSFLAKRGISTMPKDKSYTSKTLQHMPNVKQLTNNGWLEEFLESIK
jgi:sulfur relay (sulfurtransferase) DsrC/TusE family protein